VRIQAGFQPARAQIGIFGQQQNALPAILRRQVGLIDAGVGDDEPLPGGDDQHIAFGPQDLVSLA
jgi:hypothetical protein